MQYDFLACTENIIRGTNTTSVNKLSGMTAKQARSRRPNSLQPPILKCIEIAVGYFGSWLFPGQARISGRNCINPPIEMRPNSKPTIQPLAQPPHSPTKPQSQGDLCRSTACALKNNPAR